MQIVHGVEIVDISAVSREELSETELLFFDKAGHVVVYTLP